MNNPLLNGELRDRGTAVLRMHEQRMDLQKQFEEMKGIIAPVRAIVLDGMSIFESSKADKKRKISACVDPVKTEDMFKRIWNLALRYGINTVDYDHDNKISSTPEYLNCYDSSGVNSECHTVGYLAALKYDGEDENRRFKFGFSYCRPDDYYAFNEDYGRMLAMRRAIDDRDSFDGLGLDYQTMSFGEKGIKGKFYLWPWSYGQQQARFFNRCMKYYGYTD